MVSPNIACIDSPDLVLPVGWLQREVFIKVSLHIEHKSIYYDYIKQILRGIHILIVITNNL